MAEAWLDAPDSDAQAQIANDLASLALDEVATVPLGQFYVKTAYRKRITTPLQGPGVYPWHLRPV